ncbi:MAG: ErfK/YbiS/YcfS/YnhG family protein [Alphaproteobacteria bacterium]|nr:ErfK/YbiS/YcfS/YnhG family protein [Alphaproteobacteria bacterium]
MIRLCLFSAAAGLLLGSATPPHSFMLDAAPIGAAGPECVTMAGRCADDAGALAEATPLIAEAGVLAADQGEGIPNWSELREIRAPEGETFAGESRARGGVRVVISLPQQRAYVFRGGELFGTSPVSTGRRGHETPVGTFRILQKKVDHYSNIYDNAPMPFMQRLTNYGIALHAGHLPGYPASHGCIRFPRGFAKKLYGITNFGTTVTITRQRPKSAEHALDLA